MMRTKVILAFLLEPHCAGYVCLCLIAREYPEIGQIYIECVDRYLHPPQHDTFSFL